MDDKKSKQKPFDKAMESLQAMIFNDLKPGDRLPTEAELTQSLEISRPPVREALHALEASGIIEKRNGGTYVSETLESCFVGPLNIMIHLNIAKITEMDEMRKLLEIEAAGIAAQRATEEQIKEIENIVWLMQKPDLTIEEYIDLDINFHHAVAEATNNSIHHQFVKDINAVISNYFPRHCTLKIAVDSAIPLQKLMIEAIKARDSEYAKRCMKQHLEESK